MATGMYIKHVLQQRLEDEGVKERHVNQTHKQHRGRGSSCRFVDGIPRGDMTSLRRENGS